MTSDSNSISCLCSVAGLPKNSQECAEWTWLVLLSNTEITSSCSATLIESMEHSVMSLVMTLVLHNERDRCGGHCLSDLGVNLLALG